MHSFLVTSRNKKIADDYIDKFLDQEKIDPLDRAINSYEKAMGIEDVRNIQKKILLKPFKGKTKAVVIKAFENITLEAQNALLKVLEEPPNNTIIVISVSQKDLLLPTITSRCKIIELKENDPTLSNEEISQYLNILVSLSQKGIGYRLKLAQDIANNENPATWLTKMSIFIRQKMIENYNDLTYLNLLRKLYKTYMLVKTTNVAKRVALENLFLFW